MAKVTAAVHIDMTKEEMMALSALVTGTVAAIAQTSGLLGVVGTAGARTAATALLGSGALPLSIAGAGAYALWRYRRRNDG